MSSTGDKEKLDEVIRSKFGPHIFRIQCEMQTINELLDLIRKLFDCFDTNRTGIISGAEIRPLLVYGLVTDNTLQKLAKFDNDRDHQVNFKYVHCFFLQRSKTV